jgi:hypothetical protein
VVQLQPHIKAFTEKGATLSVIGSGLPQYIEGFRETTGYSGTVLTDPSLKVFAKAQLVRSVRSTFGLQSVRNGIGSLKRGMRQGKTQGDALQQGGALVISRDGSVLYHHQSQAGGDNISPQVLLSALARA